MKNIHVKFLPAIILLLTQPMYQAIIKNLKALYRKELVQMTITTIVGKKCRHVKAQIIANCSQKGGFQVVTAS